MSAKEPVEQAITAREVHDVLASQFQINLVPLPQGMEIHILQGPFKEEIIRIPAHAMTAAAKAWGQFLKQQADAERTMQSVKREPRLLH